METTDRQGAGAWPGWGRGWFGACQNPAVAQVRMGVKDMLAGSQAQQQRGVRNCHSVPRDRGRGAYTCAVQPDLGMDTFHCRLSK